MKVLAIILHSIRESLARFSFTVFFGISTFVLLFILFVLSLTPVQGGLSALKLFGAYKAWEGDPADLLQQIYRVILVAVYSFGMFLALAATSDLMPGMLKRGTIDLLLSKPLPRTWIYISRYLGGVAVVGINVMYLTVGVWLILSAKTGQWPAGFLLGGALTVFMFAVLFAFSMFVGLVARSSPLSLILSLMVIFASQLMVPAHEFDSWDRLFVSKFNAVLAEAIVDGLYFFLPHVHGMGKLIYALPSGVAQWNPVDFVVSLAFGTVFLAAGIFIFRRKDF